MQWWNLSVTTYMAQMVRGARLIHGIVLRFNGCQAEASPVPVSCACRPLSEADMHRSCLKLSHGLMSPDQGLHAANACLLQRLPGLLEIMHDIVHAFRSLTACLRLMIIARPNQPYTVISACTGSFPCHGLPQAIPALLQNSAGTMAPQVKKKASGEGNSSLMGN